MKLSVVQKTIFYSLLILLTLSQVHPATTNAVALVKKSHILPTPTIKTMPNVSVYSTHPVASASSLLGIASTNFNLTLSDKTTDSFLTKDTQKAAVKKQISNLPKRITTTHQALSTTPTSTPAVKEETKSTPVPLSDNLDNSSFEDTIADWPTRWTKDSDVFLLDRNAQGNQGSNSIHVLTTSNSSTQHLYSNLFRMDSAGAYVFNIFINGSAIGGVQFYIDEYDGNHNWISGQWKGQLHEPFTGNLSYAYIPTTNTVRIVRVQIITTEFSPNDFFLDSVELVN